MSSVLESGAENIFSIEPNDISGLKIIAQNSTDNHIIIEESGDQLFGNDIVIGGSQQDFISTSDGDDILWGGEGNDTLLGQRGDDTLLGAAGDDTLRGGRGNDILVGGSGDDTLEGRRDSDFLMGGSGNDLLAGESEDDTLIGGSGNDTLMGGTGNDLLVGGSGNNVFEFSLADFMDGSQDTIVDFEQELDSIRFVGLSEGEAEMLTFDDDGITFGNKVIIKFEDHFEFGDD